MPINENDLELFLESTSILNSSSQNSIDKTTSNAELSNIEHSTLLIPQPPLLKTGTTLSELKTQEGNDYCNHDSINETEEGGKTDSIKQQEKNDDAFEKMHSNNNNRSCNKNNSYFNPMLQSPTRMPQRYNNYDEYMENKIFQQNKNDQKLIAEYEKQFNKTYPQIFKNTNIYINGYTNPTRLQLHKLIVLHGGKFSHYLTSKRNVTHIIATNLTSKKKIEFRKYRVVQPEWIMQSIEANKLLKWQDYALLLNDTNINNTTDIKTLVTKDSTKKPHLDCNHPDFLASFFKNSRLHHLTTWKLELQNKHMKSNPVGAHHNRIKKIIYYIDFDCFFATVSGLKHNENSSLPIAVSHGQGNSDIASCNYAARSFGIKNGMWVSRAKQLCSTLKILPYEFDSYRKISETFYELLYDKFDTVIPLSVDEGVFIDYPEDIDYKGISEKCMDIRNLLSTKTKCTVSIGVSNTLVLSTLCLKSAKPNGFKIFLPHNTEKEAVAKFVGSFQLTDLPNIGHKTADKINELYSPSSIITLADLQSNLSSLSSFNKLNKLGGKLSRKIILYLKGEDDIDNISKINTPFNYFRKKSLSVDINWGIRFQTIEQVYNFIDRVVARLASQLKSINMASSQYTIKLARCKANSPIEPPKYLGMGLCDITSKTGRFPAHTNENYIMSPEIKQSFRKLYIQAPISSLRGISITLSNLKTNNDRDIGSMLDRKTNNTLDNFPRLHPPLPHDVPLTMSNTENADQMVTVTPLLPSNDNNNNNNNNNNNRRSIEKRKSRSPAREFFNNYHKKKNQERAKHHFSTEIDENALKELPLEMQKEIQREYAVINLVNSTKRSALEAPKIIPKKKLESICCFNPPIPFQKLLNPKEITARLDTWILQNIERGPRTDDALLLVQYLRRLVKFNKKSMLLYIVDHLEEQIDYYRSYYRSASDDPQTSSNHHQMPDGILQWEKLLVLKILPLRESKNRA
ncbi:uncharacterized protein SCODWIG_03274 [Saccharomycodes ludwigii]|uniref:DNA repair protein REV1 n=1 Tax=Saccharomycodes ludwigii TaxID=36035 RepID=A0A376BA13_9ASCO|nr:uncharacterized protein SCODWIG_03274 [Saccharomycodes ludwigii]